MCNGLKMYDSPRSCWVFLCEFVCLFPHQCSLVKAIVAQYIVFCRHQLGLLLLPWRVTTNFTLNHWGVYFWKLILFGDTWPHELAIFYICLQPKREELMNQFFSHRFRFSVFLFSNYICIVQDRNRIRTAALLQKKVGLPPSLWPGQCSLLLPKCMESECKEHKKCATAIACYRPCTYIYTYKAMRRPQLSFPFLVSSFQKSRAHTYQHF